MDPNFPPALNIFPLAPVGVQYESNNQKEAIEKYGIAGRVWEATRPLVQYFTPTAQAAYDPPCPVFEHASPRRIVELGSGQGLASLHLANFLDKTDSLVLTDLENVIPLCQLSIDNWRGTRDDVPAVQAHAMGWGDDSSRVRSLGPFDFILMCDLIYFPNLYPPLLLTLLELTESPGPIPSTEETFGPIIILSYHSRTLSLEESFFDSFQRYFQLTPVIGGDHEAKIYICRRWRITDEWVMPDIKGIMNGAKGIIRGRDWGLEDGLFAAMEF